MKKLLLLICIIVSCVLMVSCAGDKKLEKYRVVVPEDADISTKYAAENLVELIEDKTGIEMAIVTDNERETKREILIGETNREESKTDTPLDEMQYLLVKRDSKIVMKGSGIYIGGAVSAFANDISIIDPTTRVFNPDAIPTEEKACTYEFSTTYDSVIFMIGDGMGENHIKMAEKNGMGAFVASTFPSIGISHTRSQSEIDGVAKYTDSAAAGTAMSTGYKTMNGYIGLDKNGNIVQNIRELAFSLGAKTAVITTDLITGATPSAYLCHSISRDSTEELETQIAALTNDKKIDYIAGDVSENLTPELKSALAKISENGSNFFCMIEEGQIDKASHDKDEDKAVEYVKRFNDAIAYATQFTLCHKNTALIVTADHETGLLTRADGAPHGYFFRSYEHTNKDVPFFAIGAGMSDLNGATLENTAFATICANAYTTAPFGDQAQ